ncbi:MAG: polyphosphate polymerase domain-containing protein [Oscillospiraceae bacterium]|jgi:SPX domain protein involved in polyphosphate accumulation|nr:polyphosphate polymerase domain-containing protein [Oscillospiraceae bacterium]
MAIEIFNRYENKYMIDCDTYEKLQGRLSDYMEPDAYNRQGDTYSICNIYYDTTDSHLIRTSLQKPAYKEKLRVRSYGAAESDGMVYVEIKKKVRSLVNKRRSGITLSAAEQFLKTGIKPEICEGMNEQVINETAYLLSHKQLQPAVYLAYERMAWFGTGQHDLRVSFDSSIVTRRADLSLSSPVYGEPLLDPNLRLMEIKVAQSIPLWLSHLLSEYRIYPTSFSKYGREYQNQLRAQPQQNFVILVPGEITIPNYKGEVQYA